MHPITQSLKVLILFTLRIRINLNAFLGFYLNIYSMNKSKIVISIIVLLCSLKSISQNPLVTHIYTADPTARVFNDKLYVFPSTDIVCEEKTVFACHHTMFFLRKI